MNRRDFVKALAGIPLLGLLVKPPKRKVPYHEIDILTFNGASHRVEDQANYTWGDPRELGIGYADNADEGSLSVLRAQGLSDEYESGPFLWESCGQTAGDSINMR